MSASGPRETKVHSYNYCFSKRTRIPGYTSLFMVVRPQGKVSSETVDLLDQLEEIRTNVHVFVWAGGGGTVVQTLYFALKRFGIVKALLCLETIRSLFRIKSYKLPSLGERVFTKGGGLMYMYYPRRSM